MKCIILDDEPFAHQVLEHYMNQTPDLNFVAGFRNAVEAYEYLGRNKIDLLFLDIEMPLINGISFLKALKDKPKTIFTTAYKEYAFEGFELGVVDYLLKPFSYERFEQAIDRIRSVAAVSNGAADTLLIKEKVGFINIRQMDILYIEGCKDYIKIVTKDQTHVIYHTLKGMLKRLNPVYFIQSHKSYIVNKSFIARIQEERLILVNQVIVPIGQSYKKSFLAGLQD